MISPMPFCPSLEPCAKLTPVHVKISRARTHGEGGLPGSGSANSSGRRTAYLSKSSISPANTKPITGEISSAATVSWTLPQLTPSPN